MRLDAPDNWLDELEGEDFSEDDEPRLPVAHMPYQGDCGVSLGDRIQQMLAKEQDWREQMRQKREFEMLLDRVRRTSPDDHVASAGK